MGKRFAGLAGLVGAATIVGAASGAARQVSDRADHDVIVVTSAPRSIFTG